MNNDKPQKQQGTSVLSGEDRRRSQRVIIQVPVILELMISGQKATSEGKTIAVNVHGAMLLCPRSFDAGTKLDIINFRTNERASARVTRTPRKSAEGYLIPLEFDKPSPSFWQISFPDSNWKASDG